MIAAASTTMLAMITKTSNRSQPPGLTFFPAAEGAGIDDPSPSDIARNLKATMNPRLVTAAATVVGPAEANDEAEALPIAGSLKGRQTGRPNLAICRVRRRSHFVASAS